MNKDIDVLARTIYGEARGETTEGQLAVGLVILNRYRSNKWFSGNTITETCLKAKQFSCWNPDDPNCEKIKTAGEKELKKYWKMAESLLKGGVADITNGATHYHTKQIKPSWAKGKIPIAEIGNHLFYKNID